jgi:flagellar basal body-associated protein FliL
MRNKFIATAAAAILILGLLAGCGDSAPQTPPYEGAFDIVYPLGTNFRINANTTGLDERHELKRFNYVVCEIALEVSDASILPTFDERIHRIRQIINFTIGSKPLDQISKPEQKEALAEELVEKLNEEFNTTAISRLVFSEYYFYRG